MKTHQGGRFACVGGSLVDYVIKGIERQKIRDCCQVLHRVLDQIRHRKVVIFCFIDFISVYENRKRFQDTQRFFHLLRAYLLPLYKQDGNKMVFKLLVTQTNKTRYVHKYFREPWEVMNIDLD